MRNACSVDGCDRPQVARGCCRNHYERLMRNGDPLTISRNSPGTFDACSVNGCTRAHYARGLCNMHWQRDRRDGDLGPAHLMKAPKGGPLEWISAHSNYEGDGCLIWPFARGTNGYAKARANPTHAMCKAVHGQRPSDEHEVAHSCGKGHLGCIHPGHLRWATRRENLADKEIHGTVVRGSAIKNSKLTEGDVATMRRLGWTASEAARAFGVTRATASKAIAGKTWRHV